MRTVRVETTTVRYSARALLGLGTVALLSLCGTYTFYSQQTERNIVQKDAFQIGAEEQHFAALKKDLAPDAVVGYISDLNEAGIQLAAQYALIPILLVDRPPGALLAMYAGYFCTYVVTPLDLTWHLNTSLDRLYAQLWPSLLLLVPMMFRSAEELATTTVTDQRDKVTHKAVAKKAKRMVQRSC